MTQDEIIEMAKQCGLIDIHYEIGQCDIHEVTTFAKLIAAKEREACVAVCERHAKVYSDLPKTLVTDLSWAACIDIRDSIKRRGEA
jgi:hypothetical protein